MNQTQLKIKVAQAATRYLAKHSIIGVGSGSTIHYFIEELARYKHQLEGCVSSSKITTQRLKALGIPVIDLNTVSKIPLYIDGADEVNRFHQLIKGGGAALTSEKIIASASDQFICIVDQSKRVQRLGHFPVAVEVLPMARSWVARSIMKLGGLPEYRENTMTDHGNIILDVYNLNLEQPEAMETQINAIPGVVENGLFCKRIPEVVLVATEDNVEVLA